MTVDPKPLPENHGRTENWLKVSNLEHPFLAHDKTLQRTRLA